MKTVLGILACSFVVAACADKTPARDPSTETTATQTTSYSTPATTPVYPSTQTTMAKTSSTPAQPMDTNAPATPTNDSAFADRTGTPNTAPPVASEGMAGKNVDNTKNNERDRHNTLTPGNQGNSSSETKITADVRKGLMSSKSLSFTAKNAKIITVGTKVTLRGVVKTDAEKAEIESVARSTAGVAEVDNQLEVKK